MKLQNLTLATAMLLALTGCGSSGGGNSSAPQDKPSVQDAQTQKQVDEAKKAQAAEKNAKTIAEQKAKEARQAQAAAEQKAEVAQKAKTIAEQKAEDAQKAKAIAEQKAEEARQAQIAAEQKAKNTAELSAEELHKVQEIAKQKAEEARQAQIAAEQKAVEAQQAQTTAEQNAEAARQAQVAAEQKAVEAQKAKAEAEHNAEVARQAQLAAEQKAVEAQKAQAEAEQNAEAARQAQAAAEKNVEEIQKAKAEAEQKVKDAQKALADAEQKAQGDAEKNAEEIQKAKAEAEQKVKEAQKALADAEQKAEDAQKNLADATQSVKNAQDALAAEQQKVKEAQDALAAEKQKFEDAQKAEEARAAKYQALFDLARGIGLDKGTSHDFAKANLDTDKSDLSSALDKVIEQELDHLKGISSNSYPKGKIISEDIDKGALIDNDDIVKKVQRKMVYNQKYSATIADYYVEESYNKTAGFLTDFNPVISNIHTQGLKTQVANIPTEGTATYLGKAFHGAINMALPKPEESNTSRVIERAGTLSYTVNFADKTGAGRILGLGDQIILNQGQISGSGISSTAKQDTLTGSYSLDFFGKNAEEIGGKVSLDRKDTVGFGGTRGEIQK